MSPMRRHTDAPPGPMRRREDELEELLEHGSRNFRRYRRRAMAAFAILALTNAWALYRVADTSEKASDAADKAAALALEVQAQRRESISTNCINQNTRHDRTVAALDTLIEKIPPGPRRERAESGRAGTLLLIESLQPRQDCAALVRRSVKTP